MFFTEAMRFRNAQAIGNATRFMNTTTTRTHTPKRPLPGSSLRQSREPMPLGADGRRIRRTPRLAMPMQVRVADDHVSLSRGQRALLLLDQRFGDHANL